MAAEIRSVSEIEMPKGYYFGCQDPECAAAMEQANREVVESLRALNRRLNEQKARYNYVRTE